MRYGIISMSYCNKSALYENRSVSPRACARISETCAGACTYLHLVCIYLQVSELQNGIWLHLLAPEVAPACTASLRCKCHILQVQVGASTCDAFSCVRARMNVNLVFFIEHRGVDDERP